MARIVEVAGKRIFHAGDLNNWYAKFLTSDYNGGTIRSFEFGEIDPQKDETQYLGEHKDIKQMTDSFDVVLFPVCLLYTSLPMLVESRKWQFAL